MTIVDGLVNQIMNGGVLVIWKIIFHELVTPISTFPGDHDDQHSHRRRYCQMIYSIALRIEILVVHPDFYFYFWT